MKKIALTGGICSGKSTASAFFQQMGIQIIDADIVSREVIKDPGVIAEIIKALGNDICTPDGKIDRIKCGKKVFSSPASREKLNQIMLPQIWQRCMDRLRLACQQNRPTLIDAALIVEHALCKDLDDIIVVLCSKESQLRRLMLRNTLSAEDSLERINAQANNLQRIAAADYLLWNTDSKQNLQIQCQHLHSILWPV